MKIKKREKKKKEKKKRKNFSKKLALRYRQFFSDIFFNVKQQLLICNEFHRNNYIQNFHSIGLTWVGIFPRITITLQEEWPKPPKDAVPCSLEILKKAGFFMRRIFPRIIIGRYLPPTHVTFTNTDFFSQIHQLKNSNFFSSIDKLVQEIPEAHTTEIKSLAIFLGKSVSQCNSGSNSVGEEYLKARAIFSWIAHNISYDVQVFSRISFFRIFRSLFSFLLFLLLLIKEKKQLYRPARRSPICFDPFPLFSFEEISSKLRQFLKEKMQKPSSSSPSHYPSCSPFYFLQRTPQNNINFSKKKSSRSPICFGTKKGSL